MEHEHVAGLVERLSGMLLNFQPWLVKVVLQVDQPGQQVDLEVDQQQEQLTVQLDQQLLLVQVSLALMAQHLLQDPDQQQAPQQLQLRP